MTEILRHKKTGGLYEVLLGRGVVHSDVPLSDDAPVTVCRRIPDGQIVARFGPTPRGSFDVLHHSRLQTDALIHDGAEVVVYRAVGGGPVWVRRASEMDDGRFETTDAPQPPSSTPGEVEELLDEYTHEVAQMGMAPWCSDIDLPATHQRVYELRTALLSHISTAGRGEGAGYLAALSKKATQGEWLPDVHGYYDEDGGPPEDHTEGVMVLDHNDEPDSIIQCSEDDARFLVALVNAFRSGRLVERSAADATNPQDQE